ncbi:hypothetical protein JRO89_XSUnG0138000 [Xanthoceras sorbifolium]|uniref:Protein CHUP1, chloroplastic n=1 Tax=Xanthoceras sorbifolium TaxID=99658 RepID=A0ABQ8GY48_9ROSI|nr:hypothetical protein JRO89_XSUnG0138000 [Xanthoceras sorbifolium]
MMIIRLSFLVLASVAALYVKYGSSFQQIRREEEEEEEEEEKFTDSLSDDKPQQEEEAKRITRKTTQDLKPDIQTNNNHQYKELNNVSEMEVLHNLMKELEEKRMGVEGKLLELYGLKEQQLYISQLRNHLEEKIKEIEKLNRAVNSLCDEIKNLQEEMKQAALAERQLKMANKMIEELQMKMNVHTKLMRKQLLILEKQVSGFRGNETSISDAVIEKKLKATRQVELEFVEMQRRNKELELEKRELAVKLLGAQARITALSTMTDAKIIAKIGQEMGILRHTNEDLLKEIERLQKKRFNTVEELVYQRWVNACLRFEMQNYQTPSSSKNSNSEALSYNIASHNSDKKAKELVLYPSFDSISSYTSSTENNEFDSSSTTTGSSSNSQRSIGKKSSVMQRMKTWGRSKDDLSSVSLTNKSRRGIGQIRRYSATMVSSRPSMLSTKAAASVAVLTPFSRKKSRHESTESPRTPNFPRARRVSFCDSVETVVPKSQDASKSDRDEVCTEKSDQNSTIDVSTKCLANLPEEKNEVPLLEVISLPKPDHPGDLISSNDSVDILVDTRTETTHTGIVAHFTAALFFFLVFVLLLFFLFNLTAGIYN